MSGTGALIRERSRRGVLRDVCHLGLLAAVGPLLFMGLGDAVLAASTATLAGLAVALAGSLNGPTRGDHRNVVLAWSVADAP